MDLDNLRVSSAKEKQAALEEASEENERGFKRALGQVHILHPKLDLSTVGFYKDIMDGKLVNVE